jgi:hypothetical protein
MDQKTGDSFSLKINLWSVVKLGDNVFIKTVLYQTFLKGFKISVAVFGVGHGLGMKEKYGYQQTEHKDYIFSCGHSNKKHLNRFSPFGCLPILVFYTLIQPKFN